MAKRLVKIAKELNVGTSTIVEHLIKKGFDVENTPRAKVTEEMYEVLLKDFQRSIAIKEQADQLTIGTRKRKEASERQVVAERVAREREREKKYREEEERKRNLAEMAAKNKKAIEEANKVEEPIVAPLSVAPIAESKSVEKVTKEPVKQQEAEPISKTVVSPLVKQPIIESKSIKKVIAPTTTEKPLANKTVVEKLADTSPLKILGRINLDKFSTNNKDKDKSKEVIVKKTQTPPVAKPERRARVTRKRTIPQSKQNRLREEKQYDKSGRPLERKELRKEVTANKQKQQPLQRQPEKKVVPQQKQPLKKKVEPVIEQKEKVVPTPQVQVQSKSKVKPVEKPVETKPKEEKVVAKEMPPVEELVRAETPKLKGLKILGKIDPNRFKKPKKRRKGKEKEKL